MRSGSTHPPCLDTFTPLVRRDHCRRSRHTTLPITPHLFGFPPLTSPGPAPRCLLRAASRPMLTCLDMRTRGTTRAFYRLAAQRSSTCVPRLPGFTAYNTLPAPPFLPHPFARHRAYRITAAGRSTTYFCHPILTRRIPAAHTLPRAHTPPLCYRCLPHPRHTGPFPYTASSPTCSYFLPPPAFILHALRTTRRYAFLPDWMVLVALPDLPACILPAACCAAPPWILPPRTPCLPFYLPADLGTTVFTTWLGRCMFWDCLAACGRFARFRRRAPLLVRIALRNHIRVHHAAPPPHCTADRCVPWVCLLRAFWV